jgi:hypothetical protein
MYNPVFIHYKQFLSNINRFLSNINRVFQILTGFYPILNGFDPLFTGFEQRPAVDPHHPVHFRGSRLEGVLLVVGAWRISGSRM